VVAKNDCDTGNKLLEGHGVVVTVKTIGQKHSKY
jgi:hypothetical protein